MTERVFFCHLQKTGGMSFVRMLRELLGKPAIYPAAADDPSIDSIIVPELLLEHYAERTHEIQVITGHFPLCTTELLREVGGDEFATVTILRDPIERISSYLRHHRDRAREYDRDLVDIYDDPFRFHGLIHNHMVKMLSLTVDEMDAGFLTRVEFTPGHLERAVANLETIDVVGRLDRYAEFIAAAERRFGWDFGGQIQHANTTDFVPLPDGLAERIVADNALDIALWDHVVTTWERNGREAPRSDARDEAPAPPAWRNAVEEQPDTACVAGERSRGVV